MALDTLQSLYVRELQDLFSAETQLVKALPKLAKAAGSPALKSAFSSHLAQTKEHVRRLEQMLTGLGQEPGGQKCKGMAGLIKEGQDLIKEAKVGAEQSVLDSALITAAQKVEHYEIAGYGAARTYAQRLRQVGAAEVLLQTLSEESQTDKILTELAEATVSAAARERRIHDSAMHGDAMPGGADMEAYNVAMQHEPAVDDEDADSYKGATEEADNNAPRNRPDETSGLGARWEPSGQQQSDPVTGD